jgi:cytochrome c peroxidase
VGVHKQSNKEGMNMKLSGLGISVALLFGIMALGGMVMVNTSWAQPTSLVGVPVPAPPNLANFVKDNNAAIRLGKALFWDMQLGSDGIQACASCHFHAGADNRAKNQLSPGLLATQADITFQIAGPNATLLPSHFPNIVRNDVVSSQGVFNRSFSTVTAGNPVDVCGSTPDTDGFRVGGINVRRVEPRNTPTAINAAFFFHNFWDGRADNTFNGTTPRGAGAGDTPIFQTQTPGGVATEVVLPPITNASLASQAVGPPRSPFEMSCANRTFPDIGKKMLSLTPLAKQKVHPNDSVLGAIANSRTNPLAKGLSATYRQMIQDAFVNSWWDSNQPVTVGGQSFTQMEANFSLFFGLAVQLYEATLISDQTPFDLNALTPQQTNGLAVFSGQGRCDQCHSGPIMSNAGNPDPLIDPLFDGFQDIGVRPTNDDLGAGPIFGGGLPDFDATFKISQLRNVELTAPYFHNGSARTLEEVVEFYDRGGNFPGNINVPNGQIRPLLLIPQDKDDLVAFLKSLTDERVRFEMGPFDHPSLCIPDGHPGDNLSVVESAPGSGEAADSLRCIRAIGADGSPSPLRTFPPQPLFGDTTFATNFIEELAAAGITAGCGPGNFCPDVPLTRAQMAVFIESALGNTPNTCGGAVFTDVTEASVGPAFCGFIEKLAADGITGGCGNGNYCPNDPVSRGQMAVFIEAAAGNQGGACGGRFGDVDPLSPFCGFIERLADDGITGGCGSGNFCPDNPVTRAQMAVFIAGAFLF